MNTICPKCNDSINERDASYSEMGLICTSCLQEEELQVLQEKGAREEEKNKTGRFIGMMDLLCLIIIPVIVLAFKIFVE